MVESKTKQSPVVSTPQDHSADLSEAVRHNKILRDSQVPSLLLLASPVDGEKESSNDVVIIVWFCSTQKRAPILIEFPEGSLKILDQI